MGIRTILVPLVGDDDDSAALTAAGRVAKATGAHVTAIYAEPDPRDLPMAMVSDGIGTYLSSDLVRSLENRVEARKISAERGFQRWQQLVDLPIAAQPGPGTGASVRFHTEIGSDAVLVRTYGLVTDLIITLLPKPAEVERAVFVESGLFEAGRPVLAVPRRADPLPALDSPVLIAWRDAAETARALTASLPLLRLSRDVVVIPVKLDSDPAGVDVVLEYLSWHGIKARAVNQVGRATGEALLAEAAKIDAGLMVLGAYIHSRARALVFGGITRHLLENSKIPVLFAH